jgi:DME family drug/metabolite transporter
MDAPQPVPPGPEPPVHPLALPAIAAAATLWAAAGAVASELFDHGLRPLELVAARAALTAAGLALLPAGYRRPLRPRPGDVLLLGVALALVTATYYLAIARLPVAIAIVLQYTGPTLVVAWTSVRARRAPSPAIASTLAGATLGVALIAGLPLAGLGGLDPVGVLFGLGAALLFATYTLASDRLRTTHAPFALSLRGFTIAAVLWLPVLASAGARARIGAPEARAGILFVALGGTLVPFALYIWAIGHVRAQRAVIAATLEPVLAAGVAWVWLGQELTPTQIAGGLLVIGSVAALGILRPSE